jgi:hypothetical protein
MLRRDTGKFERKIEETSHGTGSRSSALDYALMSSQPYIDHLSRLRSKESPRLNNRKGHTTNQSYEGIFEESQLIIRKNSGTDWTTKERRAEIRKYISQEAQGSNFSSDSKTRQDRPSFPLEQAHHVLPRWMIDNWVRNLSDSQKQEVDKKLIPGFASMDKVKQVQAMCSLASNLYLGPRESDRVSRTGGHRLDPTYIKKDKSYHKNFDQRSELLYNFSRVMLNSGELIRQGKRQPGEMTYEEFKMTLMVLIASEEFHGKINVRGKGKIDPDYAEFLLENNKWRLVPKILSDDEFNAYLMTFESMECMKNIIYIQKFFAETMANHFLQLDGKFSKDIDRSIRQRGGLSLNQINEWTNAVVNLIKQIKDFSKKDDQPLCRKCYENECTEIESLMRKYLQTNKDDIATIVNEMPNADRERNHIANVAIMTDEEIESMKPEDIVRVYTRVYLDRYAKTDVKALADAFVGWEEKYNMWVEQSLIEHGGYSDEVAVDIANEIRGRPRDILAELKVPIKRYMGDEKYQDYQGYALNYARMFTKMKSTDTLYIQVASQFFETGELPERVTQQEADQLYETIRLRAGIINAIGGKHEKELIKRRDDAVLQDHGKQLLDYVKDTLHKRVVLRSSGDGESQGPREAGSPSGTSSLSTLTGKTTHKRLIKERMTITYLQAASKPSLQRSNLPPIPKVTNSRRQSHQSRPTNDQRQ